MSYITVKYNSGCLNRPISFDVFMPNDRVRETTKYTERPMKTLFLLHGYTMGAYNWIPEHICEKYNFAVVIPNGENSFWLDAPATGHKFCTFVGAELPDFVHKTFGLAGNPDDTFIMGLSMGGFGALHTALAFPERFGKTAALSSALIVREVASMKPGSSNGHANYEYYRETFGEPDKVLGSEADPEFLVKRLLAEGKKLPEIFMCCGTEDFLLEPNRQFHKFLTDSGVEHIYLESPGSHDFRFWDEYVKKFTEMMFG